MTSCKFYPATAEHSYSGYMGVVSAFRALGFEEVSRVSETQLIMRLKLKTPVS
jgi:hypothetical protein